MYACMTKPPKKQLDTAIQSGSVAQILPRVSGIVRTLAHTYTHTNTRTQHSHTLHSHTHTHMHSHITHTLTHRCTRSLPRHPLLVAWSHSQLYTHGKQTKNNRERYWYVQGRLCVHHTKCVIRSLHIYCVHIIPVFRFHHIHSAHHEICAEHRSEWVTRFAVCVGWIASVRRREWCGDVCVFCGVCVVVGTYAGGGSDAEGAPISGHSLVCDTVSVVLYTLIK